jgi:phosphoglycolate phosphatase
VERSATRAASLKEGVHELLELLRARGLRCALVTNNSEANTRWLLESFGLGFDVVLSRDAGVWKPSGAPLREAIARLGCAPEHTLAVGDSAYDIRAGREAGCAAVCILHDHASRFAGDVDLSFADVPALTRYLRIVL